MTTSTHPTYGARLPLLSVVVLARNESDHIDRCLNSLLSSSYPAAQMEILVVDGMSTDGTRECVAAVARRENRVRLVDNRQETTPAAMNVGVRAADGDLVAIVSGHVTLDPNYLEICVTRLLSHDADQVGGVAMYTPRRNTAMGRAIAVALAHPIGAGANAKYKTGTDRPLWVDSAFCSVFRREVFQRVGLFDERLLRSQDMDHSVRMRRAGFRILLAPGAVVHYFARSGFLDSTKYNFGNGFWATYPLGLGIRLARWRHLVPLAFVGTLFITGVLAFSFSWSRYALATMVGLYFGSLVVAASATTIRRRDPALLFVLPLALAVLHVGYGLGSLWGLVRATTAARSASRYANRTTPKRGD